MQLHLSASNDSQPTVSASASTWGEITTTITTGDLTDSISSSDSDIGGKVAAGVVVPLLVLAVGLAVTYYCYRKRFPVRMVMGRNFGKFSNPNYARPARPHSLVRKDADDVFQQMQPVSVSTVNLENGNDYEKTYVNAAFEFDSHDVDEEEVERRFRQHKPYLFKAARGDEVDGDAGSYDGTDDAAAVDDVDETEVKRKKNHGNAPPQGPGDRVRDETYQNVLHAGETPTATITHEKRQGQGYLSEESAFIPDDCQRESKNSSKSSQDYDEEDGWSDDFSSVASNSFDEESQATAPPISVLQHELNNEERWSSTSKVPESSSVFIDNPAVKPPGNAYDSSMTVKEFLQRIKEQHGLAGEGQQGTLYGRNPRSGSLVTRSDVAALAKRRSHSLVGAIYRDDKAVPEPLILTQQSLTFVNPEDSYNSFAESKHAPNSSVFATYDDLSVLANNHFKDERMNGDNLQRRDGELAAENSYKNPRYYTVSHAETEVRSQSLSFAELDASQVALTQDDIQASYKETDNSQRGSESLLDALENVHSPDPEPYKNVSLVEHEPYENAHIPDQEQYDTENVRLPEFERYEPDSIHLPLPEPFVTENIHLPLPEPYDTENIHLPLSETFVTENIPPPLPEPFVTENIHLPLPEPFDIESIHLPLPEPFDIESIHLPLPEPLDIESIHLPPPVLNDTENVSLPDPEPHDTEIISLSEPEPYVTNGIPMSLGFLRNPSDNVSESYTNASVLLPQNPDSNVGLSHEEDSSRTQSEKSLVGSDKTASTTDEETERRESVPLRTLTAESDAYSSPQISSDDSDLETNVPKQIAPTSSRHEPQRKLQLVPGITFSDSSSDDNDERKSEVTLTHGLTNPLQKDLDSNVKSRNDGSYVTLRGHTPVEPTRLVTRNRPVGLAALRSLEATYRTKEGEDDNNDEEEYEKLTFDDIDSALQDFGGPAARAQPKVSGHNNNTKNTFVFSEDHPDDIDV
ncbi:hypothetical protein C0Q70_11904 [Pomacea canaliculata]|uniref:Uncharacterized protein n=1 Tax=Pomacea canaliculata TaxID=400727 RepID=A0A2T7P7A9_POMCA|nr:uncharacterized protein LOC112566651 [Pomacea canaliculata]XP_025098726.1 uncharacterized protein LOC112566651 [Pomacea canaliculata]XP_025098727.1 uncharacterized protein LOC112566651 [Pomacea canaliculata]PVD29307.1 hypothetical protein C0Q70_11904 [Pomacea canaliculata]